MDIRWKRGLLWAAVIATAVLIFSFSAQKGDASAQISGSLAEQLLIAWWPGYEILPEPTQLKILNVTDVIIRKGGHFVEYALLGFWVLLLADSYRVRRRGVVAWAASSLYAVTDEVHQLLVADRAGQLRDVCLDSAGALTGVLLAILILKGRQNYD